MKAYNKDTNAINNRTTNNSLNGITGSGQNQYFAGDMAVAQATSTIDKGGMRGIGLLAMAIAEFALKKKAIDLAEDYYNTNKKDYDFFRSVHQTPMAQTASEAFSASNAPVNSDLYASVPAGIAKAGIIDRQWFEARRRIPKYNVGQQRRLDYDMAVARVSAVAAGWNIGIRYELNWADAWNNRVFDRKIAVANMGIGVGNIVRQGLAASVSNLATAYDGIGDTIAAIGNGYAAKTGYIAGRTETADRYANMRK